MMSDEEEEKVGVMLCLDKVRSRQKRVYEGN